jgi:uncharacterized coiled-coil protein SlyX
MTDISDNNITELQILIMEQQQALETMSELLIDHNSRFVKLEKELASFKTRLQQVGESSTDNLPSVEEPPPHY